MHVEKPEVETGAAVPSQCCGCHHTPATTITSHRSKFHRKALLSILGFST